LGHSVTETNKVWLTVQKESGRASADSTASVRAPSIGVTTSKGLLGRTDLPGRRLVRVGEPNGGNFFGFTLLFLSGDTSPTDNLVNNCKGVDVLIHEAIDMETLRKLVTNPQGLQAIVARHTTPEQAAGIFSRVSPRLAVFSHSPRAAGIVEQTKRSYSGRVEMGEDLMVIDIGEQVRVTRPQPDASAGRMGH
jgi:ribonuclease BN (tRNA processing enzyme)